MIDQAYHEHFPPKSMNVQVKIVPVGEINGVKSTLKRNTLVATKDFKAGEIIYKEKPIVACLDIDLMGTDSYCSYCLRSITPDVAIHAPTDPFQASYCSATCKERAEQEYENLLFSTVPMPTPANPNPSRTKAQVEERRRVQEAFASLIKDSGRVSALLIIRFIGQLLADEHARLIGNEMKYELPQVDKESKLVYSFYDYIERLRSLDITAGTQEEAEMKHCRTLLHMAVEGLEEFLDDEKYLTLKGKVAYNSFGVTYGTGRTTRPQPKGSPEMFERTRTPHGTPHQIGTAFYRVSSYINHSCAPSARPVWEGTSELHLVAAHDIKVGDQITISYVDTKKRSKDKNALDARKHRRLELARGWGFACDCSRCKEEEATLNLPTEGNGEANLPTQDAKLEPAVAKYLEDQ